MVEVVREHYIKLIGKFIEGINGLSVENMPAIFVPIIGRFYGSHKYLKIAVFGEEAPYHKWRDTKELRQKYYKTLNELKYKYKENSESAYTYLTESFRTSEIFDDLDKYDMGYINFVKKLLKGLYGEINKEKNEQFQSFIWGDTNAFEGNVYGSAETVKKYKCDEKDWKQIKYIADTIFKSNNELSFILENCKLDILLIMDGSVFNCGEWLKKYNVELCNLSEKFHYAFHYTHIKKDEVDTIIIKTNHPTYFNIEKIRYKNVIGNIIDIIKKEQPSSLLKIKNI